MEYTEHQLNWILIFIPLLGLGAQWLAWQFRLPAIVLLIAIGLLFGPVIGLIQPKAQFGNLLYPLIKVSVALILFEGGLSLRLYELQGVANGVRRLVFPAVAQYNEENSTKGFPVLLVRAKGLLEFYTKTNDPVPEAGDTLISYTLID